MASPYSFKRSSARAASRPGCGSSRGALARTLLASFGLALGMMSASACVTVRPEDKEFLAEPGMTFGSEGERGAHEEHVLSNREGSYGGNNATGGGCGCN